MTTTFVPVIAVLPLEDYRTLTDTLEHVELPADIRAVIGANGWTDEMVLLGRFLSAAAHAARTILEENG